MHILWLSWKDITHPDAGGAEFAGVEHAKALIQAGHTLHWVSTGYTNSKKIVEQDGLTYQHVGQKWMWYLGLIHLLFFYNYKTKWQKEYDLVIDEIHGPPLLTPLYVHKPIITVIHEVAGDIWKKTVPFPISALAQYIIEPLFFKAYTKVTFVAGTQSTIQDLQRIGIPIKNIHHIPYGVTLPSSLPDIPKEPTPTLIFLSQLRPMKGFDRVYEAFKKLQNQIPTIQLWVVGDDTLPYGQEIKAKVQSEQKVAISFYGKVAQNKKFELLQKAHILVHGSYKEGWGLVVIEANAMRTPCVVFDAAGLRDSVQHGITGYLANNEQEFIDDIKLLLTDKHKYTAFQQEALTWSQKFSWQHATQKFLELVQLHKSI